MAKAAPPVSSLAPAGGMPELPPVAGVRFAAVEAGVRYAGRLDVMLAEIAPGAAMAGVFTRSATRSAPVLWCEESLTARGDAGRGHAILVNSGNSNAFTGARGWASVNEGTEGPMIWDLVEAHIRKLGTVSAEPNGSVTVTGQ